MKRFYPPCIYQRPSLFTHRRFTWCSHQKCWFSSETSTTTTSPPVSRPPHIPAPTWSIASLELDQNHEPVSMPIFRRLAKRALIDIERLDDDNQAQLRQDLGNMLHMMEQQVVEAAVVQDERDNDSGSSSPVDPVELYDVPRGVQEAPVRDGSTKELVETEPQPQMDDAVYENLLQPKMTQEGAHRYFDIMTGRSVKQKK